MQTTTHLDDLLGDTWHWEEMRSARRPHDPAALFELIDFLCRDLTRR